MTSSDYIRQRALKCFALNAIIFLGSILLFDYGLLPMMQRMGGMFYLGQTSTALEAVQLFLTLIYYGAWVYPIYMFTFILNGQYYYEIASHAYNIQVGSARGFQGDYDGLVRLLSGETYRLLLLGFGLMFSAASYTLPWVGPAVSFVWTCWINAFYCFEYRWTNRGWALRTRVEYFERHWAYFLGFGAPVTLLTFFLPQTHSYAVFAFFFPWVSYHNPLVRNSVNDAHST